MCDGVKFLFDKEGLTKNKPLMNKVTTDSNVLV